MSTISAASITGVVTRRMRTEGVLDWVLEGVLTRVRDTVRTGGAAGVAGAVASVR